MIVLYLILLYFIATPIFWGISLYRYLSAKKQNARTPNTFWDWEIPKRKHLLTVLSIMLGINTAVAVGFMLLVYRAIAYM